MKNPYAYFTSDYYTTTQVDQIVYNITVSGVTQQQLDDAIVTFRTSDQIDTAYSAATSTYLTLDEINVTGSAYTDGFIYTEEIDEKISGFTTDFLTPSEIDVVFSAHTSELLIEADAQAQINSGVAISMDYWHPAPYYERLFFTDFAIYEIGYDAGSQTTIHISGNTAWTRENSIVWLIEDYAWYGTGFTDLVITTSEDGDTEARESVMTFESNNTPGMPTNIIIRQLGGTPS